MGTYAFLMWIYGAMMLFGVSFILANSTVALSMIWGKN